MKTSHVHILAAESFRQRGVQAQMGDPAILVLGEQEAGYGLGSGEEDNIVGMRSRGVEPAGLCGP